MLYEWNCTHLCMNGFVRAVPGVCLHRSMDDPPPPPASACGSTVTPPVCGRFRFTEPHNLSASAPSHTLTHTLSKFVGMMVHSLALISAKDLPEMSRHHLTPWSFLINLKRILKRKWGTVGLQWSDEASVDNQPLY